MLILTIILLLLAIVSFFIFTVLSRSLAKEGYDTGSRRVKRFRIVIPVVFILILACILIFSGLHIIDSTEIGVVRNFGEIDRQIGSGLNMVNPISETVTIYDLRVHVGNEAFASYTRDAQPLTASIEYQYSLNPAEVLDVAREYGSYEVLETKLANVVQERAKIVFARYSAMTLLENRSNLSTEVAAEVEELEELYHITFSSVIVQDIDFSDAFEQSVEQKMIAEQEALRAEQEKQTAIIQAERDAEVAEIEAQAAIAQAEGEAEAMRITREALQNMPEAYIQQLYLEKWDGKLPTFMAGDGTGILLNPDIANADDLS